MKTQDFLVVLGSGPHLQDRDSKIIHELHGGVERLRAEDPYDIYTGPVGEWTSGDDYARAWWLESGVALGEGVVTNDSLRLVVGHAYAHDGLRATNFLADPVEDLAGKMDGRFGLVELTGERIAYFVDPAGLQPLYVRSWTEQGLSYVALSNRAGLLRVASDSLNLATACLFLGTGASLGGDPLWAKVQRVPGGTLTEVDRHGGTRILDAAALRPDDFTQPSTIDEAAEDFISALSDGMESLQHHLPALQLTGGHDSRLVLAGLVRIGTRLPTLTFALPALAGYPLTEDVELAANAASAVDWEHSVIDFGTYGQPLADQRTRSIMARYSPGAVCLSDANELDLPLPFGSTLVDGVGGELGRGGFDYQLGLRGELSSARSVEEFARHLATRLTYHEAGEPLVTAHGLELIEEFVLKGSQAIVDQGFEISNLNEAWFLRFLSTWHGTKCTVVDPIRRVYSPLLSRRLWRHHLSQSPQVARTSPITRRLLEAIDGKGVLSQIPYFTRGAQYGGAAERRRVREWRMHRRTIEDGSAPVHSDTEFARGQRAAHSALSVLYDAFPGLIREPAARAVLERSPQGPTRVERLFVARLTTLALDLNV